MFWIERIRFNTNSCEDKAIIREIIYNIDMQDNLTKNNNGRFQKGLAPWNKGMKGKQPWHNISGFQEGHGWNKGQKFPEFSGKNHWNWRDAKNSPECICPRCGGRKSAVSKSCMKCSSPERSESAMGNTKNIGRKHTIEARKKMSIKRIENPSKVYKYTKIEIAIENLLKKSNIDYLKQIPLCKVTVSDFFIEEYGIAIFCDGCYWHGCKLHRSIDKVVELNKNQNRVLRKNGISVIRLWEHEIKENPEKCIGRIINLINFKQKNAD